MVSATVAVLLILAIIANLKEDNARERRAATQRDVPREQLLPRHYKSFVEIEKKLWTGREDSERTVDWERAKIKLRADELRAVREYVKGLREDFATMAYEVRSILSVLENGGRGEFVESLLREY